MKFSRRQFLHLAGTVFITVASGTLSSGDSAWSQARTIKLVVPYPPGGAVDVAARLLAEEIGKASGSTIMVEDRPGAASVIGSCVACHTEWKYLVDCCKCVCGCATPEKVELRSADQLRADLLACEFSGRLCRQQYIALPQSC
jgi:hypothetical protein